MELSSKFSLYSIMFYIVRLFVYNIKNWLIPIAEAYWLLIYDFFILRFPFIDDGVLASESEKFIWSSIGLFLFMESFNS